MSINLNTNIHLFDGELNTWSEITETEPVWTGTLEQFWSNNQDDLLWGEVRDICDQLDIGSLAHVDKGAGGVHTICTVASRMTALTWASKPKTI